MTGGRVFTSRYRPGVMFAPGPGCFIAPLLVIPGLTLFKSLALAIAFAVITFAAATAVWTMSRQRKAVLILAEEGMRLEGFGLAPWEDVESVRPVPDPMGRSALEIRLSHNVPQVIRSPLWRPNGANAIIVHTALLEDSAPAIAAAFDHFMTR